MNCTTKDFLFRKGTDRDSYHTLLYWDIRDAPSVEQR